MDWLKMKDRINRWLLLFFGVILTIGGWSFMIGFWLDMFGLFDILSLNPYLLLVGVMAQMIGGCLVGILLLQEWWYLRDEAQHSP